MRKLHTAALRRLSHTRPGNASRPLALRDRSDSRDAEPEDPHARDANLARVEAVLMMADEPLTARRLAEVAGLTDAAEARLGIERLQRLFDATGSAFQIESLAGGYQLLTRPVFHPWLTRLRRTGHDLRLSAVAMETLAIVAYRQPITKAELENIRGVSCGDVVHQLMEKGLIRITGRDQSLGRPQLFGTTKKFLQSFGLNSIKDLHDVDILKMGQGTHGDR
jgi:segregation and condensation protein B